MFFFVALTLMLILHGYVGLRFISPLTISQPLQVLYWTVMFILAILPLGAMAMRFKGIENALVDVLLWIGYTSLGIFSLAFVAFLVRDGMLVASWIYQKIQALGNTPTAGPDLARRQFIMLVTSWGIFGVTTLLGLIGFFQARFKPQIETVKIPLKRWHKGLSGLKAVQISDLHVGPTIKSDYVQSVVETVNALNPDIIFFTGDMVDGSVDYLKHDVEPLRGLQAKYGIYFVTGNHEYYSGARSWVEKTRELGMTPLMNEHLRLALDEGAIVLAGVTDLTAHHMDREHRSDPKKALEGAPHDLPRILLAHQPGTADQIHDLDIDFMPCGHTHGGQYVPFNWAVARAHKYAAGLYQQGETSIYVNRGTGYWGPPLRLGIPSEISLFEFVPASGS